MALQPVEHAAHRQHGLQYGVFGVRRRRGAKYRLIGHAGAHGLVAVVSHEGELVGVSVAPPVDRPRRPQTHHVRHLPSVVEQLVVHGATQELIVAVRRRLRAQ